MPGGSSEGLGVEQFRILCEVGLELDFNGRLLGKSKPKSPPLINHNGGAPEKSNANAWAEEIPPVGPQRLRRYEAGFQG